MTNPFLTQHGSIASRRVASAVRRGFLHERLDADLPEPILEREGLGLSGGRGVGRTGGRGSDFFPRVDSDDALFGG